MYSVWWLIDTVLQLYFFVIIATVVMSWLIAFNIVNGANPNVRQIGYALRRLTEPLLAPIRRFLPDLGSVDLSPLVLALGVMFVRMLIGELFGYATRMMM